MSSVIPTGSRFARLKSQIEAEFPPIMVGEPRSPEGSFYPTLPIPENDAQLLYNPFANVFYRYVTRTIYTYDPATNTSTPSDVKLWEVVFQRNVQTFIYERSAGEPFPAAADGSHAITLADTGFYFPGQGFFNGFRLNSADGVTPTYVEFDSYQAGDKEIILSLTGIDGGEIASDYVRVLGERSSDGGATWTELTGFNGTFGYDMPMNGGRAGSTLRVATGQLPFVGADILRFSFRYVTGAAGSFKRMVLKVNRVVQ